MHRYGFLLAALSAELFAQSQSRITGSVSDNTGAVIIGAGITVRNVGTSVVHTAVTNASGLYSIPFVNPGQYELSCEHTGFKKFVRSGLALETGTTATVNVELQLGAITETVSVDAKAALLETESGALGQLIENKRASSTCAWSIFAAAITGATLREKFSPSRRGHQTVS